MFTMVKEKSIAIITRKGFHSSQFFISAMQFLGQVEWGLPFLYIFQKMMKWLHCNRGLPVGLYIYLLFQNNWQENKITVSNQTLYTFDGRLTFGWNMLFSHVIFRLISDPVNRRDSLGFV